MLCTSCEAARRALMDAAKAALRGHAVEAVDRIRESAALAIQAQSDSQHSDRSESERIRAFTRRS